MKTRLFLTYLVPGLLVAQADLYPVEEFYGGGIGYSAMILSLDSIPGSSLLSSLGFTKKFSKRLVINGGEGFTQIAGPWRLGGYAGIGSSHISDVLDVKLYADRNGIAGYQAPAFGDTTDTTDVTAVDYVGEFAPSIEAKFSFLLGAATVEYVIPIYRDLEVVAGALLGIGRAVITIDQHSGTPRWDNLFKNIYGTVVGSTVYYAVDTTGVADIEAQIESLQGAYLGPLDVTAGMSSISGTFFNYQPYVAVKWQFLDRMGLRISAGYNSGAVPAGRWFLNGRESIGDSPKSALKGFTLRTMLYFGL